MEITEIHFDTIDSTSAYAKREYPLFSQNKITCITAETQSAGYGRHLRKWISPKGVNLYATLCFRLPSSIRDLSSLAIITAYTIAELLQSLGLEPKIKWPNDIHILGKKISGVLCETIFEKEWVQIFVGIGLNVNMQQKDLDQIDQPATSILIETGREFDRKELLHQLQKRFLSNLNLFKKMGFSHFHDGVEKILAHRGEIVECFDGQKRWKGICRALGTTGQLQLELADGTIQIISAGEVTKPESP